MCAQLSFGILTVGMSEGCGPGTTSTTYRENCWKIGTVGKPFDAIEVKLANPDPQSGEGEVLDYKNSY